VEELEEAVVTKERGLEEAAARESALRAELDATRAENNSTSAVGGGGGLGEAEAWRRRVEAAEAEAEAWRRRVDEAEAEAAAREAALRADLHASRAANNATSPMGEAVAEAW